MPWLRGVDCDTIIAEFTHEIPMKRFGQRDLALQLQAADLQIGTERGHVPAQSKDHWRSVLKLRAF